MEIRIARLDEILPLRQAVIIAGTNRTSPYFDGDDAPGTRHIAAFAEDRCVGCATFLRSEWEGRPAWQLRGMATAPESRRNGVGRALLQFAEQTLPAQPELDTLWCNARETAAGFYLKMGWTPVSDLYEVPGVGPHYRMVKPLPH